MSWTSVENAIAVAVRAASGYSSGRVIWEDQNADAPPLDYISIKLGGMDTLGLDFIQYTTDLLQPSGQEVKQQVKGVREVPLEVEVFTADTVGSSHALAIAERIRTALLLPTIRDPLGAAGVVPFDPGMAQYVPDIPSVNFRGRAIMTIRCYVPAEALVEYAESTGYIAKVAGTITTKDGIPADDTDTDYELP